MTSLCYHGIHRYNTIIHKTFAAFSLIRWCFTHIVWMQLANWHTRYTPLKCEWMTMIYKSRQTIAILKPHLSHRLIWAYNCRWYSAGGGKTLRLKNSWLKGIKIYHVFLTWRCMRKSKVNENFIFYKNTQYQVWVKNTNHYIKYVLYKMFLTSCIGTLSW